MYENYSFTHTGHVRSINEDSFYCSDAKQLWLVCDGMGGHEDGNFASRLVTDIFSNFEVNNTFEENIILMKKQIEVIHKILIQKINDDKNIIMGTTLVLLYIQDNQAVCIHLGDSRCYLLHDNELNCITKDHSIEIKENNIKKKVLTSAISSTDQLHIETTLFDINKNDIFLLCSDGFYDNINHEEMRNFLLNTTLKQSSDFLINKVLNTKADDNITLVQVRYKDEE